jgi:hypothetical protein
MNALSRGVSVRNDLERGAALRGDNTPYRLSNRVRKLLYEHRRGRSTRPRDGRRELNVTLAGATVSPTPPDLIDPSEHHVDAWLLVGDDVVCPLRWDQRGELRADAVMVRRNERGAT